MVQNCCYQIPKFDSILGHSQYQPVLTVHILKSHIPKIPYSFLFSLLSASARPIVLYVTILLLGSINL